MTRLTGVSALLFAMAIAPHDASAFSTGPHMDATKRGLQKAGFQPTAISLAQLANWQVDYVVNYPISGEVLKNEEATLQAAYYHFDDLANPEFVRRSWVWIEKIGEAAVAYAKAAKNPPEAILNALGIVLHVTQDFYGHSNFSEVDWPKLVGKSVVIYEELSDDVRLNPALPAAVGPSQPAFGLLTGEASALHENHDHKRLVGHDGPVRCEEKSPTPGCWPQHGGSDQNPSLNVSGKSFKLCDGNEPSTTCHLNRDWHGRRGYFLAMQMAAESTRYWAERFRKWVNNEALWSKVVGYDANLYEILSCQYRLEFSNRLAGQWGMLGTPQKWEIWNDASKEMCGSISGLDIEGEYDAHWQRRWRDLFLSLPKLAPFDVVNVPMPSRGKYSGGFGTFDAQFGTKKVTFALSDGGAGKVKATVVINGSSKPLNITHSDGPGFDFSIGKEWTGRLYGMNHSKNSIAGYLRDANGATNGFYGTAKK